MKKIIWITILLITLGFQEISSQVKKWTLEDCINYAIENNIDLQRAETADQKCRGRSCKIQNGYCPSLNLGSDADLLLDDQLTRLITL